jgi:hypothetical protein
MIFDSENTIINEEVGKHILIVVDINILDYDEVKKEIVGIIPDNYIDSNSLAHTLPTVGLWRISYLSITRLTSSCEHLLFLAISSIHPIFFSDFIIITSLHCIKRIVFLQFCFEPLFLLKE